MKNAYAVSRRSAFTLIELLVVIAAIAIPPSFKLSYITNGSASDSGAARAEKLNYDVIWNINR